VELTVVVLQAPEIARHSLILSEWIEDAPLIWWVRHHRPPVLITRTGDEAYAARIAASLDFPLDQAPVLFRNGNVRVLDLSAATSVPSAPPLERKVWPDPLPD